MTMSQSDPLPDAAERARQLRRRHPHLGEFLTAMHEPPSHEAAIRLGDGQVEVAPSLARRAHDRALYLHDRAIPGGHDRIESIAVAPRGVFVIASEAARGAVRIDETRFGRLRLRIGAVDCTSRLGMLSRQVAAVCDALDPTPYDDAPVCPTLCLIKAELSEATSLQVRDHLLIYQSALALRLNADGPLEEDAIHVIHSHLSEALAPA
jgi:hypothetical protein